MRRRAARAVATGLVLTLLTWMTMQGLLFYRPLPTIDGYYRFLGLDERAEVVRDVFGIPRIEAGTLHDLFFLQGYVTAQDRFVQMDAMRMAAFASDMYREPPDGGQIARDAVHAYAAGVTKWIEQHVAARALPPETTLARRRPPPWTGIDTSRIVARYMSALERSTCLTADSDRARQGALLLAAEMRSDAPAPGWYEIALQGGGVRAVGISLPGVPGLITGHNGSVAWSSSRLDLDAAVVSLTASEVDDLPRDALRCAADGRGGVMGDSAAAGSDVEAMRLALGPTDPADARARIVIDLGDLDGSKAALSTGQSAHSAAFHYRDQAQLWSAGQLHRLGWTQEAIARTEGRLVLRPR